MPLSPKPERLVNLLLLLQDRERSCGELAETLEVSRRTVMRDVAALQYMGIPIESKPGVQGGYSLPMHASIQPLQLTGPEAFLLMFALDALEQLTETPYGASRSTLLAKVRSILPFAQTDKAKSRLSQVHLQVPRRLPKSKHLSHLVELCGNFAKVEYDSAEGPHSFEMHLDRVFADAGYWYVEGISEGRRRLLRADRVIEVQKLSRPANESEPVPYDHPSHPTVVVTLSRRGLRNLERDPHLGHVAHGQMAPFVLRFRCPPEELDWYARYFGGMGEDALVSDPPELLTLLLNRANTLKNLYESALGDKPLSPIDR